MKTGYSQRGLAEALRLVLRGLCPSPCWSGLLHCRSCHCNIERNRKNWELLFSFWEFLEAVELDIQMSSCMYSSYKPELHEGSSLKKRKRQHMEITDATLAVCICHACILLHQLSHDCLPQGRITVRLMLAAENSLCTLPPLCLPLALHNSSCTNATHWPFVWP